MSHANETPTPAQLAETLPNTPKRKGMYGPWQSILVTLLVYFSAQLLAGVVIYAIPALRQWSPARQELWIQNPWVMFCFIVAAEAITLGLLYKFMRSRRVTFQSLGLNKPQAAFISYALGAFALYFLLYAVTLIVAKSLLPNLDLNQKQDLGFSHSATGISLIPIFLSLVILPPLTEEILVRGFLFKGLRTKLIFLPAAIVTSLLFAAAHLGQSGSGGLLWVAGIDTFVLSMVLCFLREKTGSLWPGIGVHMIKNALAFVVLYNILSYIR